MEVTPLNNSQLSMVQNKTISISSPSINKIDNSSFNNKVKNDIVETSSHTNKFLTNITSNIQRISSLQTLQNETTSQLEIVKNFGQLVSSVAQDSLDSYQSDVQSFISSFNTQSQSSIHRIEKIIEEKESEDSRSYFDGILGARPLSKEEIMQAIEQQQQRLEYVNKAINDEIIKTTNNAKDSFTEEKNSQNNPLFSSINFEQESKQFSKETFKEFSGAMTETQTNVELTVGEKLIAS